MTDKLSKEDMEELINSDPLTKRHFALDKLKSGELSWREYIDSLTPEELEEERERKRYWAKVWYQNNKDKKKDYCRERYLNNKDSILAKNKVRNSEQIQCEGERKLFMTGILIFIHTETTYGTVVRNGGDAILLSSQEVPTGT